MMTPVSYKRNRSISIRMLQNAASFPFPVTMNKSVYKVYANREEKIDDVRQLPGSANRFMPSPDIS